jgi:molybdopterin-containing oxidoreductase family membrane subunit
MAETITVFALIIATLQIIIDMGRPDRLLYVALYGRLQSPILWDVAIIMTYLLCSVTYLYLPLMPDLAIIRDNLPDNAAIWQRILYRLLALGWHGNISQWRRLEKVVSLMAVFIVPVGVAVHTITSWLLASISLNRFLGLLNVIGICLKSLYP